MTRALVVSIFALVLAALAPAAAAAPPQVVSAYVFVAKSKHDNPTVNVVFRTASRLSARQLNKQSVRIGGGSDYPLLISSSERCYSGTWDREGAKVGDRIRVRIGTSKRAFSRRLTIQRRGRGYSRGAAIGCDADPKSQTVMFNLTSQPSLEPDRYFFTANSGPYVKDIEWTGWGTNRAVGRGTFISDCASCFPKEDKPAKIVLRREVFCENIGAFVYRRGQMTRRFEGKTRKTQLYTGYPC